MSNLRAFNDYFQEHADQTVRHLWKYAEYETKFGNRSEIQFIGQTAVLIETPPEDRLEFMVIQTQEHRVYKHASYLLSMLADYLLTPERRELNVKLYGQGFQAFVHVNNVKVEPLNAHGTIERVNRFGDHLEQEVLKINGVRLTRFAKEEI